MKRSTWILLPALALAFSACDQGTQENKQAHTESTSSSEEVKMAVAQMQGTSGSNLSGTVTFTEENGTVKLKAELKNVMPVGNHAIHIHQTGDCSAADGSSAGGHWNPTDELHGTWGSAPHHKGDIGNFIVDSTGVGSISLTTDQWCIGCDDSTKNILGKAIIVHEGEDDLTSQPSGAAGARIGCGVIKLKS